MVRQFSHTEYFTFRISHAFRFKSCGCFVDIRGEFIPQHWVVNGISECYFSVVNLYLFICQLISFRVFDSEQKFTGYWDEPLLPIFTLTLTVWLSISGVKRNSSICTLSFAVNAIFPKMPFHIVWVSFV